MKRRHFLQNSLLASSALTLPDAAVPAKPPQGRPKKGVSTKDGAARNNEKIRCASTSVDFKLLSTDTNGDMAVFVSSNNLKGNGPPLHIHHTIDEFFCVLDGEFLFQVGDEKTLLKPGDTMFIPREVNHAFDCVSNQPGKLLVTIQPASDMENFFRQLGQLLPESGAPGESTPGESTPGESTPGESTPDMIALQKLYLTHDSVIVGPPLGIK